MFNWWTGVRSEWLKWVVYCENRTDQDDWMIDVHSEGRGEE